MPPQRIRPALDVMAREIGLAHALATRSLFTDGAELLFDYGERVDDPAAPLARQLVVVRSGQHVFADLVDQYVRADRVRRRRLHPPRPSSCLQAS